MPTTCGSPDILDAVEHIQLDTSSSSFQSLPLQAFCRNCHAAVSRVAALLEAGFLSLDVLHICVFKSFQWMGPILYRQSIIGRSGNMTL